MAKKKKNKQLDKLLSAQKGFWGEFKDFLIKGNAVSLAIGIIIGAAFQAVVNSLVNDILMPFISFFTRYIGDGGNLAEKFVNLTPSHAEDAAPLGLAAAKAAGDIVITYGALLSALINFIIIGFVVFMIVRSLTSMGNLSKKAKKKLAAQEPEPEPEPEEPTTKECPYCITEISIKATRCPHCTSEQPADEAAEEEAEQEA